MSEPLSERPAPPRAGSERAGLAFAGLCVLNGALLPAVVRLTTIEGSALFVASVCVGFGALAAAGLLAARGELGALVEPRRGPRLALVGLLGTALAYALLFEGTRRTSAITSVLCLQSEPLYALLAAWAFLGHRLSLRRVAAAAVMAFGIFLAVGTGAAEDPIGVALLLLTPLCWQASHLLALRGLVGVSPQVFTGARYLWGGLFLVGYSLARGVEVPALGPRFLALLAFQGVVLLFLGTLAWYQTIARLDLARATAIVVPAIPLVSTLASHLIVGEVPTAAQWCGLLLITGGVAAFVLAPHAVERSERVPTASAPLGIPADDEAGGEAA